LTLVCRYQRLIKWSQVKVLVHVNGCGWCGWSVVGCPPAVKVDAKDGVRVARHRGRAARTREIPQLDCCIARAGGSDVGIGWVEHTRRHPRAVPLAFKQELRVGLPRAECAIVRRSRNRCSRRVDCNRRHPLVVSSKRSRQRGHARLESRRRKRSTRC